MAQEQTENKEQAFQKDFEKQRTADSVSSPN